MKVNTSTKAWKIHLIAVLFKGVLQGGSMYSLVYSCGNIGVDGYIVEVEVDMGQGLPRMDIVGAPNLSVREATDRLRSAIVNSDIKYENKKYIVNLAPANIRKEGTGFDLPIAIGVLMCSELIRPRDLSEFLFIGELSLSGDVKGVHGVLPMVYEARSKGFKYCIVSKENAKEASVVSGIEVYAVSSLKEVIDFLNDDLSLEKTSIDLADYFKNKSTNQADFADVRGQLNVRRALEIGAAGMHNILMIGPPGSGKTMMAKRVPSILPKLSFEEGLEITKIYSIVGKVKKDVPIITKRPFRSPHHTISNVALVGGGSNPKPGEISLAHNGVLFLDELPEFNKNVIEVLRQPLEDGEITISRVNASTSFPCNFMLICSMNPCPCGFYPDMEKCTCTRNQIKRYLNKISGPLLDRIDIHVEAGKISFDDIRNSKRGESSEEIEKRVVLAQDIQKERYKNDRYNYNSNMDSKGIERYCEISKDSKKLLKYAFDTMGMSARAYSRILKVSRTIADLDGAEMIEERHIAEAISYRALDRKYFDR